ncbi:MAG: Ger(x)C family spore germination protein [Firmicutes bacterium]|nr:Ger(x)C family spore germination protein [Bacillota bacterium]MCL5039362.1 Ger(x)C family spore germination protein [Bacillota bacterium]
MLLLLIGLLSGVYLTGCWDRVEVESLAIVLAVGVDLEPQGDGFLFTVQVARPSLLGKAGGGAMGGGGGNGGGLGQTRASWNATLPGRTLFEAERRFRRQMSRRLFLGTTKVVVIGEEAARQGVGELFDYFLRDREPRFTLLVAVARGTARGILSTEPALEKTVGQEIDLLSRYISDDSTSLFPDMADFVGRLWTPGEEAVAPALTAYEDETGSRRLRVEGLAVFRKGRLVGWFTPQESRGLLWVLGKVEGGAIDLACSQGRVALEVTGQSVRVQPGFIADRPVVEVHLRDDTNLAEEQCPGPVFTPETLKAIEMQAEDKIRDEIMTTLTKAQEMRADVFGFGRAFRGRYPGKWREMEGQWEEIFSRLEVKVTADVTIRRSGLLTETVEPR